MINSPVYAELLIDTIVCDHDFNCRDRFTIDELRDDAESIKAHGLLHPVSVWKQDDGTNFLIAGFRRYAIHKSVLRWPAIRCSLYAGLTDQEARSINYTENLNRKDLSFLGEARGLANTFELTEQCRQLQALPPSKEPIMWDASLRHMKSIIQHDERWIHKRLKLLTLPEEIQELAGSRHMLCPENVETIWNQPTREEQIRVAHLIVGHKARGGKTRTMRHLPIAQTFQRPFTKGQVKSLIGRLLDRGVEGLALRLLAHVCGDLTAEEIEPDILEQLRTQTVLANVIKKRRRKK